MLLAVWVHLSASKGVHALLCMRDYLHLSPLLSFGSSLLAHVQVHICAYLLLLIKPRPTGSTMLVPCVTIKTLAKAAISEDFFAFVSIWPQFKCILEEHIAHKIRPWVVLPQKTGLICGTRIGMSQILGPIYTTVLSRSALVDQSQETRL